MALKVPEPAEDAGIDVGGEVAHWQEGKSLVFDDTYQHFAWNDTDGIRVVLFVVEQAIHACNFIDDLPLRALANTIGIADIVHRIATRLELNALEPAR